MLTARQLEKFLCNNSLRSETDLDLRGRKLRAAKIIPSSGRGRYQPTLDKGLAASIVIAAASPGQAIDAVEAVASYSKLVPTGTSPFGAETFGQAIEFMLGNGKLAAAVECVLFLKFRGPVQYAARIFWVDDGARREALYLPDSLARKGRGLGGGSMADATVLGGGLLAQIAIEIADETTAGYSFSDDGRPAAYVVKDRS